MSVFLCVSDMSHCHGLSSLLTLVQLRHLKVIWSCSGFGLECASTQRALTQVADPSDFPKKALLPHSLERRDVNQGKYQRKTIVLNVDALSADRSWEQQLNSDIFLCWFSLSSVYVCHTHSLFLVVFKLTEWH